MSVLVKILVIFGCCLQHSVAGDSPAESHPASLTKQLTDCGGWFHSYPADSTNADNINVKDSDSAQYPQVKLNLSHIPNCSERFLENVLGQILECSCTVRFVCTSPKTASFPKTQHEFVEVTVPRSVAAPLTDFRLGILFDESGFWTVKKPDALSEDSYFKGLTEIMRENSQFRISFFFPTDNDPQVARGSRSPFITTQSGFEPDISTHFYPEEKELEPYSQCILRKKNSQILVGQFPVCLKDHRVFLWIIYKLTRLENVHLSTSFFGNLASTFHLYNIDPNATDNFIQRLNRSIYLDSDRFYVANTAKGCLLLENLYAATGQKTSPSRPKHPITLSKAKPIEEEAQVIKAKPTEGEAQVILGKPTEGETQVILGKIITLRDSITACEQAITDCEQAMTRHRQEHARLSAAYQQSFAQYNQLLEDLAKANPWRPQAQSKHPAPAGNGNTIPAGMSDSRLIHPPQENSFTRLRANANPWRPQAQSEHPAPAGNGNTIPAAMPDSDDDLINPNALAELAKFYNEPHENPKPF